MSLPGAASTQAIREHIAKGWSDPLPEALPIELRQLVSAYCSARGVSTGTALFPPRTELPYHVHRCGEAITVLDGEAEVAVAGRKYLLQKLDCIFVPKDTPHRVANRSGTQRMFAHTAFSNALPDRTAVDEHFDEEDRGRDLPRDGEPESIRRFAQAESYVLSENTKFYDLFAGRFGASGICGGYGEFAPGSSLPCHVHRFDESITIVTGEAVCLVAGNSYQVSNCDTAFVPEGRPHRFLNHSNDVMAMIWVYAGTEPERTLVESGLCDGTVPFSDGAPELR